MSEPRTETRRPIDGLWDALWEDLRHNATGRPSGLLIVTKHRYAIEAEAAAESGRLREALRLLQDGMRSAGPGGSLAIDHSSWRERATKFLATPPAPSDPPIRPQDPDGRLADYAADYRDLEAQGGLLREPDA